MGKRPLCLLDLVISEDLCNLRCKYCYSHDTLTIMKSQIKMEQYQISRVLDIVDIVCRSFDLAILKISGGEIFIYENIVDLIDIVSPLVPRVKIQTNGTLLNKDIVNEIGKYKNVGLQFTLDGHAWNMNSYRVSENLHKKLIENLNIILSIGIPTEINCCVHNRNIEQLLEYAEYIASLPGNPILNFIPVRNKERGLFFPDAIQSDVFEKLLNDDRLARVLPPKLFLQRIRQFISMKSKNYQYSCRLPGITLGMNDFGIVKACPFLETSEKMSLGNIFENGYDKVFSEVGAGKIHSLLKHPRLHPVACKECFSDCEVIQMYVAGNYGEEELKKYWFFNDEQVLDILRKTKQST